ncbi:MAG: bifunctional lysylphosphatidylglycerol flippase/synthetase MprF [Ligilactobacillus acidipiscis]|jgi:phosphatidylglycerol lysyltransferase|nr:bifunctional lysylphosphatidylglycerol flippase/synthetase MprF [Ligilactobacillus acidipiscis]MCI1953827.1 bifunctional lysylphosphatidylglycerol flippase/synthetase MprF [Ligilactobacillus acidipiscis]
MKNIFNAVKNSISRRMGLIKGVFIFSVLLFVIHEVGRIAKDVSVSKISQGLSSQSSWQVLLMLLLGFAAVTPMLNYDFMVTKFLPDKYPVLYVLKTSWITNTFTNIGGFGGVLGASLRALFYNKKDSQKKIVGAIAKVALFLVSGLSLFCIISLMIVFSLKDRTVTHYLIWLFGGSLYFPFVLLLTRFNDKGILKGLTLANASRLITGSFFEWFGCVSFFIFIGTMLHASPQNFWSIIPLFVIASVIGEVSLVPGGLGSFDVFMIMELALVGVDKNIAVVWVLLYRLFYYIFPFALGVFFFIHDMGKRFNAYLQGLPKNILQRLAQFLLTGFLFFSGVLMLINSTTPNFAMTNKYFLDVYPYTFYFLNQLISIVMAFILIGVGIGTAARVKKAFSLTIIALTIAILNTLRWLVFYGEFSWKMFVFLALIMLVAWFSRGAYYRERMAPSWGAISWTLFTYLGTFIVYTVVGVLNQKMLHPHHKFIVPNALFFPSQKIWLMGFVGLILAALVLIGLLHYFFYTTNPRLNISVDSERVRRVIDEYGGNEISHLAYLFDKQMYCYEVDGKDQVIFLYKKTADKLVILGEPFGNMDHLDDALTKFMNDADLDDYSLVFYETAESLIIKLHERGFDFFKNGEEGYVDLRNFTLAGKKLRSERALVNKFKRQGYQFELCQPPFDKQFMAELKNISDEWLGHEIEKGFSLGFFDKFYLQQAPIAIVRDYNNKPVAFASLMPQGNCKITSIDLMRSSDQAPSGIMDYLFISLFAEMSKQGYEQFNLGMAPLAGVGSSRFSFIEERISHLIYEYGYKLYGFQGLRNYKEKYVSAWKPKYIAYRKKRSMIFTIMQVVNLINLPARKNR